MARRPRRLDHLDDRDPSFKQIAQGLKSKLDMKGMGISAHGVWLLAGEEEIFLSYEDFPWFKDVSVREILNVQEPTPGHFYWPDLDVDLGVETIVVSQII